MVLNVTIELQVLYRHTVKCYKRNGVLRRMSQSFEVFKFWDLSRARREMFPCREAAC